jgi:arginase
VTETYPKDIALLGVPIEVGASQGALMGPAALRTAGIVQLLESLDFTVADHGDIVPRDLTFTDEAPPPNAKHYREIKAWTGETSKRAMRWRSPARSRCFSAAIIRCRWDR